MMKWACVLVYDTISLEKLAPGTYQLTLTLVDISTSALSDSISHQEIQSLVVKK
jgi:hypothetical protein